MMARSTPRELTGRMVLAITVTAFGIIIAVNVVMAWFAVETFPGLEVRNSYVASQGFNQRLAEQRRLGWQTEAEMRGGTLTVRITGADGAPAQVAAISGILGRPTTEREDISPEFSYLDGAFVAPVEVDYGNWDLRLTATATDGTEFTQRIELIHRR